MALTASLDEIVAGGNALLAIKPHWKRVRLGDIGHVLNGYAFKAELFTRDVGMPLIRIRDVGSTASETFYSGDYDERYVVTAGDLLVGMDGDFNCARWRGPRSLLNQRVCKITVDESLYLPRFLDYVLPGYLKAINDATSSITVKHLSSRTIQEIPLPLPPMDEQREIVAEIEKQFSRLDEAVANLQCVKANLKRYKAAVLKAAVEGRLVETEASLAHREGRNYETGEQLLQRILKERKTKWTGKGKYAEPTVLELSSLPALPDGWTWATAEAACDPVVDCHNKTAPYVSKGIPLVRTANIRDGQLLIEGMRFVDQPTYEFWSKRCPPAPGDVLFTREAPMGEACVVPAGMKICLGQRTMLMRPSPAITASFLLAALMSPVVSDLIGRVAVGSGVKHLRVGDVERLPIPLPPIAEQARIVAELDLRLSVLRSVESEVDANLHRANSLRQATLASAFQSGH